MKAPTEQTDQGKTQPTLASAAPEAAQPGPRPLNGPYRMARRVGVTVVGSTVLLVGLVLLVTPGPAFVVIPVGLGILSLEFEWARRWLDKVRDGARRVLPSRDRKAPAGD